MRWQNLGDGGRALDRPFFVIRIEEVRFWRARTDVLKVWKCFETFVGLAVLRFQLVQFPRHRTRLTFCWVNG